VSTGPDQPADPSVEQAVDTIAAAVLGVPGVQDLHGGVLGEVATYLPGRRVAGVRLVDDGCDLHLVVSRSRPLAETVVAVRAAVRPLVSGPIDVTVEDTGP